MGGYSSIFRNVGMRNVWDRNCSLTVCLNTRSFIVKLVDIYKLSAGKLDFTSYCTAVY